MSAKIRIEINPKVMMGKPVIRGTRITVELILEKLASGCNEEGLLREYPKLTKSDIQAALSFAAKSIGSEEFLPAKAYS